jgi:hypothetical protein
MTQYAVPQILQPSLYACTRSENPVHLPSVVPTPVTRRDGFLLCARQAKRLYQQELALKEGLPLHIMAGLTSGFCHSLFSLPMDIAKVAPTAARDLHCVATHCTALQHISLRCNILRWVATYCAVGCNTLHCVATHRTVLRPCLRSGAPCGAGPWPWPLAPTAALDGPRAPAADAHAKFASRGGAVRVRDDDADAQSVPTL